MGKGLRSVRRNRGRLSSGSKVGLSLLMAGAAFTPAIVMTAEVAEASRPFAGGEGTAESPYLISSKEELNAIRDYPNKHFKLVKDINISGELWEVIPEFSGVLDGAGNTVEGLTINKKTSNVGYIGLLTGTGELRNLKFTNANVKTTGENIGVVAGKVSQGGLIENISVEGKVEGGGYSVGGVVGYSEGDVNKGSAKITVIGNMGYIGGIVGQNSGKILNSYAEGVVKGGNTVGGIAGVQKKMKRELGIKSTYSLAYVEGDSSIGGIVGRIVQGTVEDVYSTGNVKGDSEVGGIVGSMTKSSGELSEVRRAYATGEVYVNKYSGGGILGGVAAGNVVSLYDVYALNKSIKIAASADASGKRKVGKIYGHTFGTVKVNGGYASTKLITGSELHATEVSETFNPQELLEKNTYLINGFDFGGMDKDPIWGIKEGESLPYLHGNAQYTVYNSDTGEWEVGEPEDIPGGIGGTEDGENDGGGSEGGGSEGDTEGGNNSTSSTATQDVQVEIGAGELWLDAPNIKKFGKVKLGDKKETVRTTFDDNFKVTDARGTGEGWRLSVSASQFREVAPEGGFKAGTGNYTLPKGSLTLSSSAAVEQIGSDEGVLPTVGMSVDTVIDGGGSVLVASAGINEGMGTYGIEYGEGALSLVLDPSTVKLDGENYGTNATPYESTLTWELVSGL